MTLNGNAYAVDLDRLRAAVGSKDAALRNAILDRQGEYIDLLDARAGEEAPIYMVRDAVADLIEGEYRAPESARFMYGYAIEALCRHFGEVVPVPQGAPLAEIVDAAALEVDLPALLSGELPVPAPKWQDTPIVRFLAADQVRAAHERLAASDRRHKDSAVAAGREVLLQQLRWAADRGRAFVTVVSG